MPRCIGTGFLGYHPYKRVSLDHFNAVHTFFFEKLSFLVVLWLICQSDLVVI